MRLERFVEIVIRVLFGFLLTLNLILCALAEKVEERGANGTGRNNMLCMLVGLGFLIVIAFFYVNKSFKSDRLFLVVSSILFFVFLIFVTHFYYFETGWDAGTVIWNAELLADGKISELDNGYYSICTNNIMLTVFFSILIRIGRILPVGTDYYLLIAFQCFCVVICSNLIYKTALAFSFNKAGAHLTRLIFILLVGLSPWMVLPYSDTIAMFFMVVILYLYSVNKHPFVLGLVVMMGAMIKPTVLIFSIAIVLAKLPYFIKCTDKKKNIKRLVLFVIGALMTYGICKWAITASGFKIDHERTLSPVHYFMMGLNEDYRGVVNVDDQFFSIGIDGYSKRVDANWQVSIERIKELWPRRLIHHLLRKELYSFGDGSFAWGVEGQFFQTYIWTGHEGIENIFRDFYYPGRRFYRLFVGFMQSMWLGMILFSALEAFLKNKNKYSVLYLTIIGMVLFEVLFEPRARHLLLAVPAICILASDASFTIARNILFRLRKNDGC